MSAQPIQLTRRPQKPPARERLVRRAKLLAWLGVGWHGIEAAVAVGAGLVAGSIALIGFGADSLVESVAGIILLWRFAASRAASEDAERRAQKLIGASFYVIAAYVGFEAVRSLLTGGRPDASWVGIGLATLTLATMLPLAIAKGRIGEKLGSSATKSEGRQNMLCAYLSAALLVGLGANALFGLWWADPVTALLIAGVAVKEGRESWRGESCCTALVVTEDGCCDDDCCAPSLGFDDRLGDAPNHPGTRLACSLSGPQEARRRGEIGTIFEGCLQTEELEDGYEFRFPGSEEWATRLTEFVVFERGCCPFFAFELVFEPEQGPILLRVRGPEGAKDIVGEMVASRVG